MKREVKFRAWDKGTKDMFEGIDFHELIHWEEWELETTDGESSLPRNDVDWDDLIWMQFTGLLDKNGKEIYEGDIVKCPISGESADYLQLEADKKDFVIRTIDIPEVYMESLPDNCEVIGNIWENKNLLEHKDDNK